MPDILIRGIEMPRQDDVFIQICADGVAVLFKSTGEPRAVEAVELPPHGGLIDMDKIRYTELYGGVEVTTANWIDSLPVIVPAERGDTDA